MPVPTQVESLARGDHQVSEPFRDLPVTPRAQVSLISLVGLPHLPRHLTARRRLLHLVTPRTPLGQPNSAQTTTVAVTRTATATKTRALGRRR